MSEVAVAQQNNTFEKATPSTTRKRKRSTSTNDAQNTNSTDTGLTYVKFVGFTANELPQLEKRARTLGFKVARNFSASRIYVVYSTTAVEWWHGRDKNVKHATVNWFEECEKQKKIILPIPSDYKWELSKAVQQQFHDSSPQTASSSQTTSSSQETSRTATTRKKKKVWDIFAPSKKSSWLIEDDFDLIETAYKFHASWEKVWEDMQRRHRATHCTRKEQISSRYKTLKGSSSVMYRKIEIPDYTPPEGLTDAEELDRLTLEHTKKYCDAMTRQEACQGLIIKIESYRKAITGSAKKTTSEAIAENLKNAEGKRKSVRDRRTSHWEAAAVVETTRAKQAAVREYMMIKQNRYALDLERKFLEAFTGNPVEPPKPSPLEDKIMKMMEEDIEKLFALPAPLPIPEDELREAIESEEEEEGEKEGESEMGEGEKEN